MKHFDYIIAGGGCAGRSLALRLLPYLERSGKKVLMVDQEEKTGNDRTWCFWEQQDDFFEQVVLKRWNQLTLKGEVGELNLQIAPYAYKMIRSADFYAFTNAKLNGHVQVVKLIGKIEELGTKNDQAYVLVNGEMVTADYLFSSIPKPQVPLPKRYKYLLQHFAGWVIETPNEVFDPSTATLMDFNTGQHAGTAFVYVLPLSTTRALVEYTVFSGQLLADQIYQDELSQYVAKQLNCAEYKIIEHEHGVIPMSDHPVANRQGRVFYLGTAGGDTKASTGYTFHFIQKRTAEIVRQLENSGELNRVPHVAKRFQTYDGVLLTLLADGKLKGEKIFSRMFQKNDPKLILKFLDNETTIVEEAKLFSTLQKWQFAKAFLKRMLG